MKSSCLILIAPKPIDSGEISKKDDVLLVEPIDCLSDLFNNEKKSLEKAPKVDSTILKTDIVQNPVKTKTKGN